ncbi:MAG TPA: hypothetical protein PKC77_07970 [Sphingopyxis sp.]|nr:hypothetical protein [Sphingopyxis sp.]
MINVINVINDLRRTVSTERPAFLAAAFMRPSVLRDVLEIASAMRVTNGNPPYAYAASKAAPIRRSIYRSGPGCGLSSVDGSRVASVK